MVRAENMMRAITYARKYLAPWGSTHMKELQRVLATLAFKSNTECTTYKVNVFHASFLYICTSLLEYYESRRLNYFLRFGQTLSPSVLQELLHIVHIFSNLLLDSVLICAKLLDAIQVCCICTN